MGPKCTWTERPLKYDGLAPWEIFLSEAQERMTVVVPPEKIDDFLALAKKAIGRGDRSRGVHRLGIVSAFSMTANRSGISTWNFFMRVGR